MADKTSTNMNTSSQRAAPESSGLDAEDLNTSLPAQDNAEQSQDINMQPPAYCSDPFNPIHYEHVDNPNLEDVIGDRPESFFTSPLPKEAAFLDHPAVRLILDNPFESLANPQEAIDAANALLDAHHGPCSRSINDFMLTPKEEEKLCFRCRERIRSREERWAEWVAKRRQAVIAKKE
ncbi:hypothetical protein B0T20DRAFT_392413 [Sordaria brevicollis]|uniref:Uncharacterized protein n=1 Tax=Sordaria brevicollis TaxID=83679 RepID=A0AAE0PGG4_SORBR|nr:hypothetical protein B0T20DRAFT_392413 [Sordaria brevicollis]